MYLKTILCMRGVSYKQITHIRCCKWHIEHASMYTCKKYTLRNQLFGMHLTELKRCLHLPLKLCQMTGYEKLD